MNDALNPTALPFKYFASRSSVSRIASETSRATSNIVVAPSRLVVAAPSAHRCVSTLTIAWVPARFPPELSSTITRLPGISNTVILQNLATLSTPAFVRESEAKMSPSFSITPMQYVTRYPPCHTCELPVSSERVNLTRGRRRSQYLREFTPAEHL